jgi:hypothetical protein
VRHWIPPAPLAAGLAYQLAAWLIVLAYAFVPSEGLALAWVHAVALGWLTTVALAVLLFVVSAFTDLPWRGENVARAAAAIVPLATALLVLAFAAGAVVALDLAAAVLLVAIGAYVAMAVRTLRQPAPARTEAAIARALAVALSMLALTALLGAMLAGAYGGGDARVLALAPSHALLGIGAWLTVLVSGVSVQTFRPMFGTRSRWPRAHVASGAGLLIGAVMAAVAAPWSAPMLRIGVALGALGTAIYAADALDIVRRATTPHPALRAFAGAAVAWLIVAAACAVAASWGITPLGRAAVVAALAGWLGGMVNAHLHHLGVRVVVTFLRGDDDETRPWEVLDPWLTWLALAAGQIAVAGAFAGTVWDVRPAFAIAGIAGVVAVLAMLANVLTVRRATLRERADGSV